MAFEGKLFDDVSYGDFEELLKNEVEEAKGLDYKAHFPGGTDDDKKEFLYDIVSFANTSGGHIIYGIREAKGIPIEIVGLGDIDYDAAILRLENMARDGIAPRIPAIASRVIRSTTGSSPKSVIVTHIPRSWAAPHMVTFRGSSKFYARNSKGKYQLDINEIRAAFLLSETAYERIRNFRADRIAKIVVGDTPVPLPDGAKIILHIIPLTAFGANREINLSGYSRIMTEFRPMSAHGWSSRYNFDGYLAYSSLNGPEAYFSSYLQLYRNGIIEATDAYILSWGERIIPSKAYEEELLEAAFRYTSLLQRLGWEVPFIILISLIGVQGYTMAVDNRWRLTNRLRERPIDRDILAVPEIIMEMNTPDLPSLIRPAFDAIWNAAGWERSIYYDKDGKRIEE